MKPTRHLASYLSRRNSSIALAVFGAFHISHSVHAQTTGWNKTGAGPFDYNDTANWHGGTINGVWDSTLTLTGNQTTYFGTDTTLSTGLSFGYAGNYSETLRGSVANRLLTLGGDITVATTGGTAANVTIGSTTSNQNLNVNLGGITRTISTAAGRTLNFVNVISNGAIEKTGAGALSLSGVNLFSGGVTLNEGTLNINNSAGLGTGSLTINGGFINAIGAARTTTNNNTQNWNGDFTFVGSNTLDLGTGGITLAAPLTLTTTASTLTFGGTITGGTLFDITKAGAGTLLYTGNTALTASKTVNITAGTLATTGSITGGHALTLNGAGTLSLRGATANAAASAITANAGTTLTFDSSTADAAGTTRAASVTLKGASLSVLGNSTANSVDTITGALTINSPSTFGGSGANTVTLTPDAATNTRLTAGSLTRTNNGALFFRGTNLGQNTIVSNTAGASNITFTTAPTAQLIGGGGAAGTTTISILPWAVGATTASGVPTGFVTYDANNGIRVLSSGAGEYATTLTGGTTTNNNVMLNAASPVTADGATTINSLFVNNHSSSATVLSGTDALTVTSGAIYADFSLGGNNNATTISKAINFGAAEGVIGTMGTSNSKTLSFTGGISGSSGITVYHTAASSNQSGVNIGAATTYTGNTIIHGSLIAANANAIPNTGRSGDVYVYGSFGVNAAGSSAVRINGLYGTGRVLNPFSSFKTLEVGYNDATSTFDGIFSTSNLILTKVGTGTLTLTNTGSSYTGGTNIQNGTLSAVTLNNVAAPNATSSLGRPVDVNNGTIHLGNTTTTGNLKVTGTGETTDRVINFAGTTGGGGIEQAGTGLLKFTSDFTATGGGIKTLTLSGSTAGIGEIAGAIVNNSVSNTTAVTKSGTGTWVLSNTNNTYTGATTVQGGTLQVDGSLSSSSAVTVNGNARLSGIGTVGGAATIQSSGVLTAGSGNGTGTLTVGGGTTLDNGSIFSWDIAADGGFYDKLVTSTLSGEATAGDAVFRVVLGDASLNDSFWNTSHIWQDIFTTDGSNAIDDWASLFTLAVVDSNYDTVTPAKGSFSISGNTLSYAFTAVPEPTTALAGILLGAGLLRRRRR